jgi:hypothetical protein
VSVSARACLHEFTGHCTLVPICRSVLVASMSRNCVSVRTSCLQIAYGVVYPCVFHGGSCSQHRHISCSSTSHWVQSLLSKSPKIFRNNWRPSKVAWVCPPTIKVAPRYWKLPVLFISRRIEGVVQPKIMPHESPSCVIAGARPI